RPLARRRRGRPALVRQGTVRGRRGVRGRGRTPLPVAARPIRAGVHPRPEPRAVLLPEGIPPGWLAAFAARALSADRADGPAQPRPLAPRPPHGRRLRTGERNAAGHLAAWDAHPLGA